MLVLVNDLFMTCVIQKGIGNMLQTLLKWEVVFSMYELKLSGFVLNLFLMKQYLILYSRSFDVCRR